MKNPYSTETGCCSRFNPEPWDGKEFRWQDKLFIKDRVRCLFYMPIGFGNVMTRIMERISTADAFTPEPPIALSDHTSKWNMDLYVEVAREVPGAENVRLSGTFLTKVFEGPFKETGRWCAQMSEWVQAQGKQVKRQLMYYTTCPKCAKHYGKNYVVILAEV
ncbi:MAG TPA: hypothetical protein P5534_04640 [Candidatus Paceibacterota bacterium]|nr:hypothetical protein [Candidatus Paceibacterota bacterium]